MNVFTLLQFLFFLKNSEQQYWNAGVERNRGYVLFSLIFTLGAIEYAWMDEVFMFDVWILL